jgi:hypothetical protein
MVGGIQLLYAAGFSFWALVSFRWVNYWLNVDGVYMGGRMTPYLDTYSLFITVVCGILSLCGCMGGWGLLRLRSWARPWEIAYVGVLSVFLAADVSFRFVKPIDPRLLSNDHTASVLMYLFFALPYFPFLFVAPMPRERPVV